MAMVNTTAPTNTPAQRCNVAARNWREKMYEEDHQHHRR
jgi:hypothetical protein